MIEPAYIISIVLFGGWIYLFISKQLILRDYWKLWDHVTAAQKREGDMRDALKACRQWLEDYQSRHPDSDRYRCGAELARIQQALGEEGKS